MKNIKRVLAILGILILILLLGAGIFANTLKPDYKGKKGLSKLTQEVTVHYDAYGIPHIYGENEEDAIRALGYVHAQDRLWQMELLRRIGRGGLSEVFGKDMLGTDKFFLSLGIDDATEETLKKLDMSSKKVQLSEAYLDGINQFIEEGPTPIEFYLTGIDKEPFTLTDIYNTFGYMAFSFAQAHKTDPLLTDIKNKLGVEYLMDLAIDIDPNSTLIKNHNKQPSDSLLGNVMAAVTNALKGLPIPQFEGSNSWVIGASKTKNGKVIFANDPHIGFAQPSVWYEAHLNTPTYEKYGYHLAGVPFPLLAHDRKLAYGLTMFENDDIDFYYEKTNPEDSTQYQTAGGWNTYETVNKIIKVKDSVDVTFSYKKTHHGPILNGIANQIKGEEPISMSWVYTKHENKILDVVYDMSHANNLTEFKAALPNLHAPGLNIMYGDAENNVAWFASAKLYHMSDSVHTKFILNGESGKEELVNYIDFSENPQAVNPPWDYVYSANNQPDSIAGMLYPGYYLPENRAKRIVQLLEPKNDWDRDAVGEMITDVTSAVDPRILLNLYNSVKVKELVDEQIILLDKLSLWNGTYTLNSIEATVYTRWLYFVLKNTFHDELGEEMFKQFLSTHFHKRLIAPLLENKNSIWWNDIRTVDKEETLQDVVHKSYVEAMESLRNDFGNKISSWTWDKVHTIEHGHPIGQVESLRSYFNVGPFPVQGSREVINNMAFGYDGTGKYKVTGGPSTRRVIDFSDVENSMSILPTGQSGNPFSPHYDDQADMYINGEFRKMMMNKKEIEKTAKSSLTFAPVEQ
ncbi:penicillin amidase [Saonia flava]|uniref:Penicillin amidase n=1 Tax=Saonia flava TaxID=523696 RepID=A0A846QU84_9FLAO|nr:penicillin acylase family protein [Saonia flava]NJB70092.1 penicillin amidase [Saonia flava]